MSEADFQRQETLRVDAERRKTAAQQGTPLPDTVEEFIAVILPQLHVAPAVQEYIRREHATHQATVARHERLYARRLREQDAAIDAVKAEVEQLRRDVAEWVDNFNVFASRVLAFNEARLAVLQRAADTLEQELTR